MELTQYKCLASSIQLPQIRIALNRWRGGFRGISRVALTELTLQGVGSFFLLSFKIKLIHFKGDG
jgi:hypothetical protein